MAVNQFLTFAGAAGADILSFAAYSSLPARTTGFQSGIADRFQLNTVWRQASTAASALAQIGTAAGQDMLDNGDASDFYTKIVAGINALIAAGGGGGGGGGPWTIKTGAYTAVANDKLVFVLAAPAAMGLPATHAVGASVQIGGNFATNNLTINPAGSDDFVGFSKPLVMNKSFTGATLVWTTGGWQLLSGAA